MTDVTHLPTPGVVLDLDTEERDPKDIKPPFIANIAGRAIQFADPNELEWRDLASVEGPGDLLRISLSEDDVSHLRKQELPTWKFGRLIEAYYNHYDLEQKIRDAKRQSALGF